MEEILLKIARSYDQSNRGVPRLHARHIAQLSSPIDENSVVHDNGCGPVVVTEELFASLGDKPRNFKVEATDNSPPMIVVSNDIVKANGWDNVTVSLQDSTKLLFPDNTFTHSFVNFLVPIQSEEFGAIYRTLKPGGETLYTNWKDHDFVNLMHRCIAIIFPDKHNGGAKNMKLDERKLRTFFEQGGFRKEDVDIASHKELLHFKDKDDLMDLVNGPFGRFFTKDWKEEELARLPDVVDEALTPAERESKSLNMVAWVVRAKKV